MVDSVTEREFQRSMERMESLIQALEQFSDPRAKVQVQELLQCVLELHGAALERIFDQLAQGGEAGLAVIDQVAGDELVGSVLLLHGLHPLDLETRVRRALDQVRPYLHSHGGDVELLAVEAGALQLRMQGSCHGCPSSALTLKRTIEEAIHQHAPDVTNIHVEGLVEPSNPPPANLITTDQLRRVPGHLLSNSGV